MPTSPHEMPARPLQFLALGLWTVDVPLFGYGLGWDARTCVSLGA